MTGPEILLEEYQNRNEERHWTKKVGWFKALMNFVGLSFKIRFRMANYKVIFVLAIIMSIATLNMFKEDNEAEIAPISKQYKLFTTLLS